MFLILIEMSFIYILTKLSNFLIKILLIYFQKLVSLFDKLKDIILFFVIISDIENDFLLVTSLNYYLLININQV